MHADEARAKSASITSRRVTMRQEFKITRECREQHVEKGSFKFSYSRKYKAEGSGKVPSIDVEGKKVADCRA